MANSVTGGKSMAGSKRGLRMADGFRKLTDLMARYHEVKNHDYANAVDPLANLRKHGEYGIVVRMDDKTSRLESFFGPKGRAKLKVKDEKIEDTCIDLANYALLLILLYRDNQARASRTRNQLPKRSRSRN